MERDEEDGNPAKPWKVYAVTVLADVKGSTWKNHARVSNNADSGDVFDAPYDNLDATLEEATQRCTASNGGA